MIVDTAVWIALIAMFTALAGPYFVARQADRKQKSEWARQDFLVAQAKIDTDRVAGEVKTVAIKLLETNAVSLHNSEKQTGKIEEIHSMLNSEKTAGKRVTLTAFITARASLVEIVDLKKQLNQKAGDGTIAQIGFLTTSIDNLTTEISLLEKQQTKP